jgi:hypothetical protein
MNENTIEMKNKDREEQNEMKTKTNKEEEQTQNTKRETNRKKEVKQLKHRRRR